MPNNKHQALLSAFEKHVDENDFKYYRDNFKITDAHHSIFAALEKELGEDLSSAMADYLVDPTGYFDNTTTLHRYNDEPFNTSKYHSRLACVAAVYILENPSEYAAKKIVDRFKLFLNNNFEHGETPLSDYGSSYRENSLLTYYFPKADDCLVLLAKHMHVVEVTDLLKDFVSGVYYKTYFDEEGGREYNNYDQMYCYNIKSVLCPVLKQFYLDDELDSDLYQNIARYFPSIVNIKLENEQEEFSKICNSYKNDLLEHVLEDLPNRAESFCNLFRYDDFKGLKWVIAGLQQIASQKITAPKLRADTYHAEAIRTLLNVTEIPKEDLTDENLSILNEIKQSVVKIALPHCDAAKPILMGVLDMNSVFHVERYIKQMDYVANMDNPANGVIKVAELLSLTEQCDKTKLHDYLVDWAKNSDAPKDEITLILSACDFDREKIEKKLVRHGQTAIKAYGLFPLKGKDELRERYLAFKTMHKDAKQYGTERTANTRAAVAAGLSNLAQVAGFTDANRMEWALEADLAEDSLPFDEWQSAGDWEICLKLDGLSPRIVVQRNGKILKSVPAKVRQHDNFKAMRAVQNLVKEQASRFKSTLQDMMCHGDLVEAEELEVLRRLPVVATMLSQLVMKDSQNRLGFFDAKNNQLIDVNGSKYSINGNLVIAHALDLFHADQLSAWQKHTVENRIVQPFKQVFRELYILTPAEIKTKDQSLRFNGHQIDPSVGGRLFQSRGWSTGHQEDPYVSTYYPAFEMSASLSCEGIGHYFAESCEVVLGELEFTSRNGTVNLEDVSPLMFSEVMRDLDLVASVAQLADNERFSTETALIRSQLLTAVLDTMGLANVSVEGNHAHVEGKLAQYSVHLGSGVIHIVPGNYLCIVPAQKSEDDVYLPFADKDKKMQEIIAKVLLLSNDDKITDRTILNQINPQSRQSA